MLVLSGGDREAFGLIRPAVLPSVLTDGSELGFSFANLSKHFTSFSLRRFALRWLWFAPELQHSPQGSSSRFRILFSDCGFVIRSQFVNCDARMLAALPSPMGLN